MLTLRQINNGNTAEKNNKTLLITVSQKCFIKKFYYVAPSASLTFHSSSKHVKKSTWVNFLIDLAKGGFNLILVIMSHVVKC